MSDPITQAQLEALVAQVNQQCDLAIVAVTQTVDSPWNNDRAIALANIDKVRTQSVPALRSLWARHGDDDPDRVLAYATEVIKTPAAYTGYDAEGSLKRVLADTAAATATQTAAVAKQAINETASLAASAAGALLPTWAKVGLGIAAVVAVIVVVAVARGQLAAARATAGV